MFEVDPTSNLVMDDERMWSLTPTILEHTPLGVRMGIVSQGLGTPYFSEPFFHVPLTEDEYEDVKEKITQANTELQEYLQSDDEREMPHSEWQYKYINEHCEWAEGMPCLNW